MIIYKAFRIFALIILLFTIANCAWSKSIRFIEWTTNITVNKNSTILVQEEFTAEFSGEFNYIRHNISLENAKKVSDIKVYYGDGKQLEKDLIEIKYDNKKIRLKIKLYAKDEKKKWIVEYKAHGSISFLKEYNVLQWVVIPTDSTFAVEKVTARISLPAKVNKNKLEPELKFRKNSRNFRLIDDEKVEYWGENISPYESFIILLKFPKGILQKDRLLIILHFSWSIIPLLTFCFQFSKWYESKKTPIKRRPIIFRNEPPNRISPAEMAFLIEKIPQHKYISATLVDLAQRGYINVLEQERMTVSHIYLNYKLQKKKEIDNSLKNHEITILDALFGSQEETMLSEVKDKFINKQPMIQKAITNQLISGNYLTFDKANFRKIQRNISLSMFVFGAFLLPLSKLATISFMTSSIIIMLFSKTISVKTLKGIDAEWQSACFAKFLKFNERFHLRYIGARLFDEYLPYALALGVEKEWANRFADIYIEPPEWFIPLGEFEIDSILRFMSALESEII